MKNKKEIKAIICRKCGVRFGEDNRAFEIGKKWEKSLCYVCKMESMTKKQLQKFAELQFKRWKIKKQNG